MSYISVEVDVDLEDIDDCDLFEEINQRLKKTKNANRKKELENLIKENFDFSFIPESNEIKISTLNDVLKMELMIECFNKYSLNELESLLK